MIEDLEPESFPEAVALWRKTGLTRPWNDPMADLKRAIEGETSTVLAACSEAGVSETPVSETPVSETPVSGAAASEKAARVLLGTAMVGHDGHRAWVYYVAVSPDHRGQGVGRALMHACEEWVRARGIPKIQLMVRHTNPGVIEFYKALGYVDAETTVLGRFL